MSRVLNLHLDLSERGGGRICYLLLPGPLKDSERPWLERMAEENSCYIAVISGIDWENDLTPWPAAGIKSGSKGKAFGDGAEEFLRSLCNQLIPELDKSLGLSHPERYIAGVSLSGLFALWASCKTDLFEAVGCVSASLWYDGFTEWLSAQQPMASKYYFSLGIKEKDGKNPRLASVEEHTLRTLSFLKSKGKQAGFEYNEGNHFGPLLQRMSKALLYILAYRT